MLTSPVQLLFVGSQGKLKSVRIWPKCTWKCLYLSVCVLGTKIPSNMCPSVPHCLRGAVAILFAHRSNYLQLPLLSPDGVAGVLLTGFPSAAAAGVCRCWALPLALSAFPVSAPSGVLTEHGAFTSISRALQRVLSADSSGVMRSLFPCCCVEQKQSQRLNTCLCIKILEFILEFLIQAVLEFLGRFGPRYEFYGLFL